MIKTTYRSIALTMFLGAPVSLAAQETPAELMSADQSTLQSAIQMRYDAALAKTNDSTVISADNAVYKWASEAKVQCGIALGYLKSKTRDETSISKCNDAYNRMLRRPPAPPAPAPQPLPAPPAEICQNPKPGIVFFDFDSEVPKDGAVETIEFVATNAEACGWDNFQIVGHTDRAGTNAYNDDLSMRRAQSIATLMTSLGIERARMQIGAEGEENQRVPTEDGVRNPQNRRVEITVSR